MAVTHVRVAFREADYAAERLFLLAFRRVTLP
jgi:hypothetical protein